jgi:ribonuclease HI
MQIYKLFTDGSSTGSVGEGGWAFLVTLDDIIIHESSGGSLETTNNRMELLGVIEGLKYIASNLSTQVAVEVYSDSQYVVKGLTEWFPSWQEKMARGKTIKNQDLWLDAKAIMDLFSDIQLKWIRGHDGNVYNERCDALAKIAKSLVKHG